MAVMVASMLVLVLLLLLLLLLLLGLLLLLRLRLCLRHRLRLLDIHDGVLNLVAGREPEPRLNQRLE